MASREVYVGNLSRMSSYELEKKFSKFGKIRNLTFKAHFAFVEYYGYEESERAVNLMNKEKDNQLVVNFARPRNSFNKSEFDLRKKSSLDSDKPERE